MKVYITYGLPASGKTTWATGQKCAVVDCDTLRGGYAPEKVANAIRRIPRSQNAVVVDGLFTTEKQLGKLIEAIKAKNPKAGFEIEFWEKNIDACWLNDNQRKCKWAGITIKQLGKNYKKPSKKFLQRYTLTLNEHKVQTGLDYLGWWKKYNLSNPYPFDDEKHFLYNEGWVISGKMRNYHGDEWEAGSEPQPVNFDEFDKLLEQLVPNLNFLQYKKLYRKTVEIVNFNDHDYYHNLNKNYYVCDLYKLNKLLKEMKLI